MNPTSEELRLIDLNFIESRREFARWADRARVVEESGVLVTETDNPVTATFLRVDPAVPAAQV